MQYSWLTLEANVIWHICYLNCGRTLLNKPHPRIAVKMVLCLVLLPSPGNLEQIFQPYSFFSSSNWIKWKYWHIIGWKKTKPNRLMNKTKCCASWKVMVSLWLLPEISQNHSVRYRFCVNESSPRKTEFYDNRNFKVCEGDWESSFQRCFQDCAEL